MAHDNHLTPHDAFFKRSLNDPQTAKHLLERYLPKKVLATLKLDTIEVCKMEYVDKDLKKSASDVVLRVKTVKGETAYVYLLAEHMRTPQKVLSFRILKYLVHIMDDHCRKYKTDVLPLVFPLIIYNGDVSPYPHSRDIFDLFAPEHREQARNTLLSPYPLIDLSQSAALDMPSDPWLTLLFNALKYAPKKNDPEMVVKVIEVAIIYLAKHDDLGLVHTALRYFYEVRDRKDHQAFWEEFKLRLQPVLGEEFMISMADELRQEGMQQGMQQGIQQGVLLAAKNFLASGFDVEIVAKNTGLSIDMLRKLQNETKH